jgi:hypothetical protein
VQHERQRLPDDAGQQADGPVDALPAKLEVAEAAALQSTQLWVYISKED